MFYTQHRLGGQSNILISAHYTEVKANGSGKLSDEAVFASVRQVLNTYPDLALIGVPVKPPGETKHKLHLAALHEIDLEECVEFRDDEAPRITTEMIETLHNEWDLTSEKPNPRKPWWKVVVLGRQEVAFVAHHLVCDGRFGTMFHSEFLKALNAWAPSDKPSSRVVQIDPERTRLEPSVQEFWTSSKFMLWSLFDLLKHCLMHLVLGRWLMFHAQSPRQALPKHPFPLQSEIKYRPQTGVSSVRVPSSTISRMVGACREQGTTFTPFFNVTVLSVLADEHYPKALLGGSYCATDMRGVYPKTTPGSGQLLSCGGGGGHMLRLGRYRGTFGQAGDKKKDAARDIDVERIWELTKEYRRWMNTAMAGNSPQALEIYRINNAGSVYLEDMVSQMLPALGWYQRAVFNVSNLGAFAPGEPRDASWKIDDVNFSAAAVHGSISYKMCVNIAGVKGGDTVLNACFEEGVLSREMVDSVLREAVERMEEVVRLWERSR